MTVIPIGFTYATYGALTITCVTIYGAYKYSQFPNSYGIIGIGSGGNYALAAAKVLMETDMKAEDIAKKAIKVASEICVFTNNNITMEKL